jgi:hypothetical protein
MIKMKWFMLLLSGLCIFSATAFGDLVVIDEGLNNTGNNSTIKNGSNSGKAVNFVMGSGSNYKLTSVVLGLDNISASATPSVALWSDDGTSNPIGSLLETLSNPGTLVTGANTFTSSLGTTLNASTTYWIVVTEDDPDELVTFDWVGGTDDSVTSDIGASHTGRFYGKPGEEASWYKTSSVLNQIQVYATAIPEPATMSLVAISGLALMLWRRKISR